ncbi:MAG: DUF4097 family beta strand repeat-containing protein [Opitutaceae bacterium]
MKSIRRIFLVLAPATALFAAQSESNTSTIAFSDPAKSGRLEVRLARGDVRIQGADTAAVTVNSVAKPATSAPRKDGLRVISSAASFSLTEKDNLVVLDATADGWGVKNKPEFNLTVPRGTAVVVQNSWGGDITCAGIAGNLEINSMNGEVRLDEISGGAVVSTMNGEIRANIRELRKGSPLSFTSMNGEVVLRVPADAGATVRLRTQNGAVLTDFDETALVTKTESTARTGGSTPYGHRGLPEQVQERIRHATQVSVTAVHEAIAAVKDGFEAAKERNDALDHEAEVARGSATKDSAPVTTGKPSTVPKPPRAPKPVIATISGGKLVTGTLNGGGAEISVSTMNGDVTLRKLDAK